MRATIIAASRDSTRSLPVRRRVRSLRRRLVIPGAAGVSAVLWAYACGDGTTDPPPQPPPPDPPRATTLTVTPATAELTAFGASVQLAAEVRDQNGSVMAGVAVVWSSGDAAVATIDASGLVTAVANGTTTITVAAGSISGSATVTVKQVVTAVTVEPAAGSMVVGDTLRLSAEASDANGHAVDGTEVEWASSDASVARVDDSGLVTAVAAGAAQIAAVSSGVTGSAAVTVLAPVPATVAVTPDTVVFAAIGQTAQFAAEVRDQRGRPMEGVAVSWSSADAEIATADSVGLVTAVGPGTTTVTASAGEASGDASVTVLQSAESITVTPSADTIGPGDTLRLAAVAYDANGQRLEGVAFTWSSSDAAVAAVGGSGLVRGVAEGSATITASAGPARGTSEITVENPDRAVLMAFYEATGGPNWGNNENWLTDAPLRTWHGVIVNGDGRVSELNVRGNNVTGFIPPVLHRLPELRWLRLDYNSLTGSIPGSLGEAPALEFLNLSNNGLTGSIPPELGDLRTLRQLWLFGNQLTGSIPPELGKLTTLLHLLLHDNRLTGSIPPELGELTDLWLLWLFGNQLTGSIPPELGNLRRVEEIALRHNRLTGPIPATLGQLTRMQKFGATNNNLTGPIPPELGRLTSLERLWLQGNDLSGPLPPELGGMRSLRILEVTDNSKLAGSLPAALTSLRNLETLLAGGTGLCTPADADFLTWLHNVPQVHVKRCESATRSIAYLTQAVQSPEYPVPLIAGDSALLRVFVVSEDGAAAGANIPPARVTLYHGDAEVHAVDFDGTGTGIPANLDESDLNLSLNTMIPGSVIEPGLEIVVEIDPDTTLDAALGVAERLPASGRMPIQVKRVPLYEITLIPFLWTQTPDSALLAKVNGMTADSPLLWATREFLPVHEISVDHRDPIWLDENPSARIMGRIFTVTYAAKQAAGGRGHWMGAWSGCCGVASFQGQAGGIGLEPTAADRFWQNNNVLAHELGHLMTLPHAPCNVGDPDPNYPYPGGVIGSWGYDMRSAELRSPESPEFMSYCGEQEKWASGYYHAQALRWRLGNIAADQPPARPVRSLMLWGGVGPDGKLALEPAFALDAVPTPPVGPGPYRIAGLDGNGRELFSRWLSMNALDTGGAAFAVMVPVQPEWVAALERIELTGPEGRAEVSRDGPTASVLLTDPETGQIRGFLRHAPDIDAMADSAQAEAALRTLVPEPGLVTRVSRGVPAAGAWNR